MIGTLDEAQEIFELNERAWANADYLQLPEGWEFIDSGGTRRVFRGPSGICYKVNYEDREGKPNYNELEHRNFRRIDQEGKLPRDWRVPRSHIHRFRANLERWEWTGNTRIRVRKSTEVTVLACDYVEGKMIGGYSTTAEDPDHQNAEVVFAKIGLNDLCGDNVIKTDEHYYIVDAAETMLSQKVG